MAPAFQRLVNKWVSISRNANADTSHKAKAKSGDHSTLTAETSTVCSSHYAGSQVTDNNNQENSVTLQPDNSTSCQDCSTIHEKFKEYMEIKQYFEELQCKECQGVLSDAIKAVESLNVKSESSNDAMSEVEEDSWLAEEECSSEDSSDDETTEEQSKTGAFLYQLADFVEKFDDIPFDLIDLWVPVFNPDATGPNSIPQLCHAGHIVASNAPNGNKKHEFGQMSMIFFFCSWEWYSRTCLFFWFTYLGN